MRDLFASDREKRLWIGTLVVLVALFSTLGLARTLADAFAGSGVGVWLFGLCCLLVLATIVTQGFRVRPGGLELAVALGVIVAYVLVFVRMAIHTERSHLIEYGIVAVFIYEALLERRRAGRPVGYPALIAVVATSLIGVVDECVQWFLPSRTFDRTDMLFNFLAAVMAIAASASLGWARDFTDRVFELQRDAGDQDSADSNQ